MSYRDYEMKIANLEEELEIDSERIAELEQKNTDLQFSLTGALETADYYKNGYETLEEEANNHFDFLEENEGVQANLNADLSQRHSEDLAIIKKLEEEKFNLQKCLTSVLETQEENEKEIRLLYKVFEYLLSKLEK